MSATKTALKAAKAALDAHKYGEAIEQAKSVTAVDPTNYNANVFLGLAHDKQGQNETSEESYRAATKCKNKDPLAWQGLVTLYEKHASNKLDAYHDAAFTLAEIYMEKDDKIRCQTVLDKYTNDAKKYGSRSQFKRSLEVFLPTGPLYEYLEGRIPQPAHTYIRIAELVEAEEKERINTEIGQRRTRLGARIDQVTIDVKREVLESSQLETLYGAIVDWTHDDEVRRQYEEKLLQRVYDHLAVLPAPRKQTKRAQVQKLAEGLVILKHPFLLAWSIHLEWSDVEEIQDMDVGLLEEHITMFPDDGRSKVLKGYLESDLSTFSRFQEDSADEKNEGDSDLVSAEERLILMNEGIEENPESVLSHRIMAQYYLSLEEHESAAITARQGRHRIQAESNMSGLSFEKSIDAMNIILGTSLVHYQAPRHHPEAKELFEKILSRKPTEISALLGVGMILEEQEDYADAVNFLGRALKRSTEPRIRAEAAWCKALNGDHGTSLHELEACLPEMEGSDLRSKTLRSQTLYRIGMCIWNGDQSSAARKSRDGAYARFIASLQADMNNAPAYTSLGIYYRDYAKDRKRARKCFQKAFELSSSEIEAAHSLAKSFAKSSEWDLVEVVAQRVIESGRYKPAPGSRKTAVSWPFAALGVVQLNNQDYTNSAVSFQSALRMTPVDYHCWVGLGESYHNSGRYIAATKAFEQAQKLETTSGDESIKDNWFSKYMLANVKRELGEYDDAVAGYRTILETRPIEYGVSITLLQTIVEGAWHNVDLGFFGRAADGVKEAIDLAQKMAQSKKGDFNLWKAIGDACSIITYVQAYAELLPLQDLELLLSNDVALEAYDNLAEIDKTGQDTLTSFRNDSPNADYVLLSIRAAILAHKQAIHACANDVHAKAVAWYNLGWTEHRAHACRCEKAKSSSKKRPLGYLKTAVQCFKRAIELEAKNAEFWNSLGIVTTELNPKVAQHAFVRSLYLNDKNARVWTNLGTLYMINEDLQLANEAFCRAQSSDPDYAQAWVGQALLANRLADPNEARTLFTHAYEIANSASIIVKRQYAISSFDHLISSSARSQKEDALRPLLALRQLRSQVSGDVTIQHLLSLFAERVGDYSDAILALESVSTSLEAEYETSESPVILMRFAQAKADLARAQLAHRDFEAASENAETAVNLTDEEGQESKERPKIRPSAYVTAGLAHYHRGSMDEAISMFRNALEETKGDPDILCLLAQVLWAKGGHEERGVAREQLFDCIEKNPGHVNTIILLGTIAILDDDHDTIEAVIADLQSLRTRQDLDDKQQGKVSRLLAAMAAVVSDEDGEGAAEATDAKTAIMLAPFRPHGWSQLADLDEDTYPAEAAVLTATKAVPPGGSLGAVDLAKTYLGTRRAEDIQQAIMLAPWMASSWKAMSNV